MIDSINSARSLSGEPPLAFSGRLSRGATAWARTLMQRGVLAHSAGALRRGEGEMLEWHSGAAAAVPSTVAEWLASSTHRGLMLSGTFHRGGAGRAVGWLNGVRGTIWVVRLAR